MHKKQIIKKVCLWIFVFTFLMALPGVSSSLYIKNVQATEDNGENIKTNEDLTVSKKTELLDWEERTYKVSLTAKANSRTIEVKQPVDVVMVLDRSGSMEEDMTIYSAVTSTPDITKNYYIKVSKNKYTQVQYNSSTNRWYYWDFIFTQEVYYESGGTGANDRYEFYTRSSKSKLQALKEASINFVDSVKADNSDSRIAIVSFAGDSRIDTNYNNKWLLGVGNINSYNHIISKINSLNPSGATRADLGMAKAKEVYDTPSYYENVVQSSDRKKVVVFFTDGVPTTKSDFSDTVANAAISTSNTLKGGSYNAIVYSIGVFLNFNESTLNRVENYMKEVASLKPGSSSQKLYYKVDDSEGLEEIFQDITEEIGGEIDSVYIRDYIDPRFLVLGDDGTPLQDKSETYTLSNGGKVKYDSEKDSWYVQWEKKKLTTDLWSESIYLKAKEEFIGGNDIATNTEDSGVFYGEKSLKFVLPKVNVRANIKVSNKENTIFLGEAVPISGILEDMYSSRNTNPFLGMEVTGHFTLEWFKEIESLGEDIIALGNIKPSEDSTFILKVSFTANEVQNSQSTINSKGNYVETASAEGIYLVKVKSGTISLKKIVLDDEGNEVSIPEGDYFTIKVRESIMSDVELSKESSLISLTKLSKGKYTLQEIMPIEYEFVKAVINGEEYRANDPIEINISMDAPEVMVIYTNRKVHKPYFHGRDRVENTFKNAISQ